MTGFVYAISDGKDAVKIGWGNDPYRRLSEINVGSPHHYTLVGFVAATREQEQEAHSLLAPSRVRGEWFRCDPVVKQFVAMIEGRGLRTEKSPAAQPMNAKEIIDLWPSMEAFASDIGLRNSSHVRVMKVRNSIHSRYWGRLVGAAEKRGLPVTLACLAGVQP